MPAKPVAKSPFSLCKGVLAGLRYAVAPPRCMGCLKEGTWMCRSCRQETTSDTLCIRDAHPPSLTGIVSAGTYNKLYLRRGIDWLKFKGVRELAHPLAQLLAPALASIAPLEELQKDAVLVPIPLHKRKLRQRGFNQSLELAHALSAVTEIPVQDVLIRTRATWTQNQLPNNHLRKENLENAFQVLPEPARPEAKLFGVEGWLDKKYILLLDDVTTSGSTLASAAEALNVNEQNLPIGRQAWGVTIAKG